MHYPSHSPYSEDGDRVSPKVTVGRNYRGPFRVKSGLGGFPPTAGSANVPLLAKNKITLLLMRQAESKFLLYNHAVYLPFTAWTVLNCCTIQ